MKNIEKELLSSRIQFFFAESGFFSMVGFMFSGDVGSGVMFL